MRLFNEGNHPAGGLFSGPEGVFAPFFSKKIPESLLLEADSGNGSRLLPEAAATGVYFNSKPAF
jgi:hypothetical protein